MSKYLCVSALALVLMAGPAAAETLTEVDGAAPNNGAFHAMSDWYGMADGAPLAVGSRIAGDVPIYAAVDGHVYHIDSNHRVLAVVR